MEEPRENYWKKRLEDLRQRLEKNNFRAYVATSSRDAKKIVEDEIIPDTGAKSISWGGSMTFIQSGLYDALKDRLDLQVLDTFDKSISPEEGLERRRRALLVDLFITGTNAVTESGQLVNLDMYGNRVGAIAFGPRSVVLLVGRNKIVSDLDGAMVRVKDYAAPTNAMRLDKNTPCAKTSYCEECKSPDRICNTWTITEKSYPKGRMTVVLINEDVGL